jgi:hypothetical protein
VKQAKIIQNHRNSNDSNIEQGEPRYKKFKRLKLGGGQAYDHSSVRTAVVAWATNDGA